MILILILILLLQASVPPPRTKEGGNILACGRGGGGSPNSDDWRKSLAFCLLCGRHYSANYCSGKETECRGNARASTSCLFIICLQRRPFVS